MSPFLPSPRRFRREAGFTLVELAVVLMVIGLFVGAGVYGLQSYREHARIMNTETNLRRVEAAITNFVAYRGRLPRPAANEGDGDEGSLGAGSIEIPEDGDESIVSEPMTIGFLPWQALGLSAADARDGWGHWFRYAVDDSSAPGDSEIDTEPLRCDGEFPHYDNAAETGYGLYLRDGTGNPPGTQPGNVSYVVYSVGADNEDQTFLGPNLFVSEATGSTYDDTAIGRSADQVLIDSGCRVKRTTDWNPCGDDGCEDDSHDPDGPFVPGQVDFTKKRLTKHFNSSYEGYSGTKTHGGHRTVAPSVDTSGEVPVVSFDSIDDHGHHDVRSCFFAHTDMPLIGGTVRAYFEAAFDVDTVGNKFGGLVFALLPWELPVRNGYNSLHRCGYEGDYLGFSAEDDHHNSTHDLYRTHEFYGHPDPDYQQVMPLGVELDVGRSSGNIEGHDFHDPPASGSERDHVAIVVDNGFHDPSPGRYAYGNDSCIDGDAGCYEPGTGTASDRLWLERGQGAWHKVRVEIEDGAEDCASDEVEIRAWIWPAGKDCGDPTGCIDLGRDYGEDATAYFVKRCQIKPTRTVDMGSGWQANSWDRLRPGFTTGMPNAVADRNMPSYRKFIAGGTLKWSARPDSAGGVVSAEIHNDLFRPHAYPRVLNWPILVDSGANQGNGWTGTSKIAAPDLGVTILSYRGEITVTPTLGRWNYGFGVKGVGGPTNEWDVPPLDNTENEDERGEKGEEEALSFHFDKRYDRAMIQLGQLETGEKARLVLYQAADYAKQNREYIVQGCNNTNGGGLLDLSPGLAFDSVYVEPLPANEDRSGTGTSFYVRSVRLCDASATDGACSITLEPWQSPCTLTASQVE